MVNANALTEIGTFSGFVMPFFRERTYRGNEGRPGFPIPAREDDAVLESPDGKNHVDWAARWWMRVGAFDIGLAHFSGTGREPRLVATVIPGVGPALVPHCDLIDQSSIDAQATLDAWLLKLEAVAHSGQGDSFAAATTGFEYTLYQVFESSADLGLISEYHYDGRDDTAPFTLFDNDVMVGARLAFNDIDDTSVLLGAINDLKTGTTFMTLEAGTRIADGFKLEIEGRAFPYVANGATESVFERDHRLEIRLQRFF